MQVNMNGGAADRAVRVAIGLALLSAVVMLDGDGRGLRLIGLVPLLTAAVRFCPLYSILGAGTCPAPSEGP